MPSYVVITDSAGVALGAGPIYRATGWTAVNRLDRAGRCSFEVPAADPRAQELLANKREAHYYTLRDGSPAEIGALIIDQIEMVLEGRSEPMLRVSGDNLLAELSTRTVGALELYETEAHTAHSVAHTYLDGSEYVTADMPEAYDGSIATTYALDTGLKTTDYLYVCGQSKISAIWITFGSGTNSNTAEIAAQYYDGSSWQSCEAINDGTWDTNRTWFKTGGIFFTRPGDQVATTHNDVEGYWIRLTPTANLSDGIIIADISVEEDIPTADGLAAIMALAPDGWAVSADGYAATEKTAYLQYGGETVLEALIALAEHTGEHFRLGTGKTIEWLQDDPRAAPVDSGVYAVAGPASGSHTCAILELAESKESYELATRIYPYGARQGNGRVTLALCTEMPPAGYTLSTVDNYLKADTAENTYGQIDHVREWPDIGQQDDDAYHAVLAANSLYQVALEWLQRYSAVQHAYTLRVAHLEQEVQPGETVRVTYQRSRDGERYIDIDRALVVLGVTLEEDGAGIRTAALELATIDTWPLSGTDFVLREMQAGRRLRAGDMDTSTTITQTIVSDNVNIDGGTIDGTAIGSNVPASGVFTTLGVSGASVLAGGVAVTGNIGVTGTVDGIDISSHAANPAAHHAPVTAGNSGIGVVGQAVSLALAPTSGLDLTAGLALADSVAGNGLAIANKVLGIGQGAGLTVSADAVALTTPGTLSATTANNAAGNHTHGIQTAIPTFTFSTTAAAGVGSSLVRADATLALFEATVPVTLSAFSTGATGAAGRAPRRDHVHGITSYSDMSVNKGHLAKSDADGRGKWAALTATEYLRTSLLNSEPATALTIAPALDLYLSPGDTKRVRATSAVRLQADNYVSQTTGWAIGYNGAADFRYIYTDELHAKAFIADLEQALAGGQIISKSVAPLSRDFTAPAAGAAAYLWVECFEGFPDQQVFQADDVVMLRNFSRAAGSLSITNCFGTVTAPYFPDPQSEPPEQRWTFTRLTGTVNGQPAAGTMAESAVVKRGALALDFGVTGAGYHEVNAIDGAMGEYSPYAQNVFWTAHPWYDRTVATRDGNLRGIFNVAGEYGLYAGDGTAAANQFVRISNEAIEAHNLPVHLYDGADITIALEPGSGTPSIAIGDPLPTGWLTQPGWWAGKDGTAYKQYVGQVSGGDLVRGAMWDGTNYHVRGNLIVGPGTGFVVEDALLHCPFDGTRPYETAFDVDLAGHLGQAPTTATGGIIGRPGKFGKAVQVAGATQNMILNPSFETGTESWSSFSDGTGETFERNALAAWIGSYGLRWVLGSGPSGQAYLISHTGAPTQGVTYTASVWVKGVGTAIGKRFYLGLGEYGGISGHVATYSAHVALTGEWQRFSVSRTVEQADRTSLGIIPRYYTGAATGDELYVDAAQIEAQACPTPYCDGSLGAGHAWTGTAHGSSSTRAVAALAYAQPLPTTGPFSIAAWIIPAASAAQIAASTDRCIWRAGTHTTETRCDLWLSPAWGGVEPGWYSGPANTWLHGGDLSFGPYEAQHLVCTWDGRYRCLYLNGILLATSADESATPPSIANTFWVGRYGDSNRWNGWLDDLLLLDRAMSADEVKVLYESGKPVTVTTSPMSLLLTGPGRGKVEGNASGLYGWDEGRNPAWALATEAKTFGGATLGAGDVFMGSIAGGHYLHWDDSAGKLTVRGDVAVSGSVSVAWQDITNPPDGAGRLGTGTPGSAGLWLTGSHVGYYNGSSWPVDIGNDGTFYFSKDANNYVKYDGTTFEVAGKVKITDVSGFAGSGVLLVGTGTKDSDLNGWAIDSGEIVGQAGDGKDQVVLGTDGKIKAGGGNVILGGDGFRINALSTQDNKATIRYVYTDDTVVGRIYTLHATSPLQTEGAFEIFGRSSDANLYIGAKGSTGKKGYIRLRAETDSQACDLILTASSTEQYVYASRRFRASDGIDVGTPGKTAGTGGAQVEKYIGVGINYTPGDGNVDASGYIRGQKGVVVGDGVSAPTAASGVAFIYVDSADGDLKVKFGDGTTKTLATDT